MPELIHVLLVEDHPADVALTRKAFARLGRATQLHVALNGLEAMAFLQQTGRFAQAPRPDIVLLDLNMPRMGGLEVLDQVRAIPSLSLIPFIILTTSAAPGDVVRSYALGANSYVVKPVKYNDFLDLIQTLDTYWLETSQRPPRPGP